MSVSDKNTISNGMQSEEIRNRFLAFFEKRGHKIIPSASVVPYDDPTVLFTTAGMQPLVPYILGQKHPGGRRLVNVQKCIRTQDIDKVGDNTHDTFFEMLGNWSLGDYFKEDAIKWSYEFLTDEKEGLGLDPNRLYITCFAGDDDAPRDTKSAEIWESLGIPKNRTYFLGKEDNWWSPGDNGPSGPDTEMFYDTTKEGLGDMTLEQFKEADRKERVTEIWNDVFMEYEKKDGKIIGKLSQKNVDTGAGLERIAMVMQKKDNIFDTDLFKDVVKKINSEVVYRPLHSIPESKNEKRRAIRIIADHVRTAVFIIAEGVTPSKSDRGYVLRRLIRRATYYGDVLSLGTGFFVDVANEIIKKYQGIYPNLKQSEEKIIKALLNEESNFRQTLQVGLREFEKISSSNISGDDAFRLFSTYGFPLEMTVEMANEKGIQVNVDAFGRAMEKHQKLSRAGAEKKFKGGLSDHSADTIRLHTATHLLQSALRCVLGTHVIQRGSNITKERLRFDFSHPKKVTPSEIEKIEALVNKNINRNLTMCSQVMSVAQARKEDAIGIFDDTYAAVGDKISVYSAVDSVDGAVYSKEVCGGPHVERTGTLGHFKITKEEAVSSGVRRIKAILLKVT